MAFRQPALPPVARRISVPVEEQQTTTVTKELPRAIEEPQEWILFPQAKSLIHARTTSTERTSLTAGLSRLSDFGSIISVTRSANGEAVRCEATVGSLDEDEELDSLDDGLHAFHQSSSPCEAGHLDQSGSILPGHDGLGAFQHPWSAAAQDQIWHFERYNPRKRSFNPHQRRPSSVKRKLDEIEDDDEPRIEEQKKERIEQWRLEHSRILLDEIEKETRRRQSFARSQAAGQDQDLSTSERRTQTTGSPPEPLRSSEEQEKAALSEDVSESFLQMITRRVIRNFIGFDEHTLSIIFGEALPASSPRPSAPAQAPQESRQISNDSRPWQSRLLHRLARELGILLDQLSEQPGTSTTSLFDPSNSDYAGIPVTQPTSSRTHPRNHSRRLSTPLITPSFDFNASTPHSPPVSPSTFAADSRHASLWGIEEEESNPNLIPQSAEPSQAYWEQPPNLHNILTVVRAHFTASGVSTSKPSPAPQAHPKLATASASETFRRAALIRQYHPLVNRLSTISHQRESSRSRRRHHHLPHGGYGYAGSATSCRSRSLRMSRSRRGTTMSTTSVGSYGSSRNFWDIGIGGSAAESGGGGMGMGMWGEV